MCDQSASNGAQMNVSDGTRSTQLLSDPSNGAGAPSEFEIRLGSAAADEGRKALRSQSSTSEKKVAAHLTGGATGQCTG